MREKRESNVESGFPHARKEDVVEDVFVEVFCDDSKLTVEVIEEIVGVFDFFSINTHILGVIHDLHKQFEIHLVVKVNGQKKIKRKRGGQEKERQTQ